MPNSAKRSVKSKSSSSAAAARKKRPENRYAALIRHLFEKHYVPETASFEFPRSELEEMAAQHGIVLPKNQGDLIYSFRYRNELPSEIKATAGKGLEWVIEGAGRARYRFKQAKIHRIVPRDELLTIKVPDSTPEIIAHYALNDEQALLAKVRYNRIIDIFLGITAYSLQNHLRTTVKNVGQIEIDEVYVGIDRYGRQYVVPVQAKGGKDKHGVVQTQQDAAFCAAAFSSLLCRPVSAQFMADDRIAMFELAVVEGEVKVLDEKHYQLVPANTISAADLMLYSTHGSS